MPITLAMSTLMGLSTLCVISQVVPSRESFTPEGVEASSVTPMQIGPATKPIVDQYQGTHSSTQEELCHGCQSSRVQLQHHQPTLSTSLVLRHQRSSSGSNACYRNSARAFTSPPLCTSITGWPICSCGTQ